MYETNNYVWLVSYCQISLVSKRICQGLDSPWQHQQHLVAQGRDWANAKLWVSELDWWCRSRWRCNSRNTNRSIRHWSCHIFSLKIKVFKTYFFNAVWDVLTVIVMLLRRSLIYQWNRKDDQHLSTGLDHDVCPIDPKAWRDLGLYRVVMIERNHFFGFGETKKNYGPLFPWGFSRGYLSSLFRELFKQLRRHSLIHVCYWKKKRLEKKASSPKMQLKYFKRTESTKLDSRRRNDAR